MGPYRPLPIASMVAPLAGSWDTHCHIFAPDTHPYIANTPYRPPAFSPLDLLDVSTAENHVIVLAVPDGTDPSLMLESIEQLQSMGRRARATIVMDLDHMTPARLRELWERGVRSVRVHIARLRLYYARDTITRDDIERYITDAARRIHAAGMRWPIDMQLDLQHWVDLVPTMRRLHSEYSTSFVADHVFTARSGSLELPGLDELLSLMREGVLVVKISGLTRLAPRLEDVVPLVRKVITNAPEMVVWGSDTPHVVMDPTRHDFDEVDVGAQLDLLRGICEGHEGWWEMLMQTNAERLYA